MGLFEALEQAAGLTTATPGAAGASPSATAVAAVGAVVKMVQAQPGGVTGVIQRFESAGLGGVVGSWVGAGANQNVSPQQVQSTLGAGPVGQVAQDLGVSHDEAAGHIAQFLPLILGHLGAGGQSPTGGGLAELAGLVSTFAGGKAPG